ncbi:MAG: hypothetical protein EZS28_005810 [Streblomastix strix]|uniref:Uncharacterized protein n=1 Tax=Streblomastix strix TaxID=222440 RepID=A0A5J4WVW9_9EUKA|nr:MAG: hypothetical protein EZS28_005810 [Streblomastix strix]
MYALEMKVTKEMEIELERQKNNQINDIKDNKEVDDIDKEKDIDTEQESDNNMHKDQNEENEQQNLKEQKQKKRNKPRLHKGMNGEWIRGMSIMSIGNDSNMNINVGQIEREGMIIDKDEDRKNDSLPFRNIQSNTIRFSIQFNISNHRYFSFFISIIFI